MSLITVNLFVNYDSRRYISPRKIFSLQILFYNDEGDKVFQLIAGTMNQLGNDIQYN